MTGRHSRRVIHLYFTVAKVPKGEEYGHILIMAGEEGYLRCKTL